MKRNELQQVISSPLQAQQIGHLTSQKLESSNRHSLALHLATQAGF